MIGWSSSSEWVEWTASNATDVDAGAERRTAAGWCVPGGECSAPGSNHMVDDVIERRIKLGRRLVVLGYFAALAIHANGLENMDRLWCLQRAILDPCDLTFRIEFG